MALAAAHLPRARRCAQEVVVNLRPQFQAGRTTRYQLWYDRDVDTTIDFQGKSQSIPQHFHYDGEMTWRVDSVAADGSATCTLLIAWLKLTSSVEDTTQVYDTRKRTGDSPCAAPVP